MKVDIFSKQQLLDGYIKFSDDRISQVWLASVHYHKMDLVYEDCLYSCEYFHYDSDGRIQEAWELPKGKKELSLWDLQ
ncbi:hypothetical protein NVP1063O_074 [Vibrio phage 1.063.O._10N.261.45.C7]|nr:hypothetical protein NVP1063O_074 [Vibrio phage 1.063.O._10N.261.45.C7]